MKKIVRILAGLVMGLMCVNCASARSGNEEKVSETRSVNPFHSIEVESVASVYFTQSDTYSLRVEGEKKWVNQTKCTVKDGVLLIAWAEKGKKTTRNVNGLSIYISAPDLQKVAFEGVGSCKDKVNVCCLTVLSIKFVDFICQPSTSSVMMSGSSICAVTNKSRLFLISLSENSKDVFK